VKSIRDGWWRLTLQVDSPDDSNPPYGKVEFHLHDTFVPDFLTVEATGGQATCEFDCYGAFTVGAHCLEDNVLLELDLAEDTSLPYRFRTS
jgi:hypothetical protein